MKQEKEIGPREAAGKIRVCDFKRIFRFGSAQALDSMGVCGDCVAYDGRCCVQPAVCRPFALGAAARRSACLAWESRTGTVPASREA